MLKGENGYEYAWSIKKHKTIFQIKTLWIISIMFMTQYFIYIFLL